MTSAWITVYLPEVTTGTVHTLLFVLRVIADLSFPWLLKKMWKGVANIWRHKMFEGIFVAYKWWRALYFRGKYHQDMKAV